MARVAGDPRRRRIAVFGFALSRLTRLKGCCTAATAAAVTGAGMPTMTTRAPRATMIDFYHVTEAVTFHPDPAE